MGAPVTEDKTDRNGTMMAIETIAHGNRWGLDSEPKQGDCLQK